MSEERKRWQRSSVTLLKRSLPMNLLTRLFAGWGCMINRCYRSLRVTMPGISLGSWAVMTFSKPTAWPRSLNRHSVKHTALTQEHPLVKHAMAGAAVGTTMCADPLRGATLAGDDDTRGRLKWLPGPDSPVTWRRTRGTAASFP